MKKLIASLLVLAAFGLQRPASATPPVTTTPPVKPSLATTIPTQALERHVTFFATPRNPKTGQITFGSLYKGAKDLDMDHPVVFAALNVVGPVALANLRRRTLSLKLPVAQISKAIDPTTTGTFNGDGVATIGRVDALFGHAYSAAGVKEPRIVQTSAGLEPVLEWTDMKALIRKEYPNPLLRAVATTRWKELFEIIKNGTGKTYATRSELMALYSVDPDKPSLFDNLAKDIADKKAGQPAAAVSTPSKVGGTQ